METKVLMERAKQIALGQGTLASSPGERSKGGIITLCAAACIAKAGVELSGEASLLSEFDARLLSEAKNEYVPALFEAIGLTREFASQIMLENDSRDRSSRLAWFTALEC